MEVFQCGVIFPLERFYSWIIDFFFVWKFIQFGLEGVPNNSKDEITLHLEFCKRGI